MSQVFQFASPIEYFLLRIFFYKSMCEQTTKKQVNAKKMIFLEFYNIVKTINKQS